MFKTGGSLFLCLWLGGCASGMAPARMATATSSPAALQSRSVTVNADQLPAYLTRTGDEVDTLALGAIKGKRIGDCELSVENKSRWSIRIFVGESDEGAVAPFDTLDLPVDAGDVALVGVAELSAQKRRVWKQSWSCMPKRSTTWTLLE